MHEYTVDRWNGSDNSCTWSFVRVSNILILFWSETNAKNEPCSGSQQLKSSNDGVIPKCELYSTRVKSFTIFLFLVQQLEMSEPLGVASFWGFTPSFDLFPEEMDEQTNILLINAGDIRHIMHSVSKHINDTVPKNVNVRDNVCIILI